MTNPAYLNVTEINGAEYYFDMVQGTDEWDAIRRGKLTASGLSGFLTPKLKIAPNAATKTYIYSLVAQRITGFSEPHFMSYDMERGHLEEGFARDLYGEKFTKVDECGFIINHGMGFAFGCSPDGLVGEDGMIEIKARVAKHQIKTIAEFMSDTQETAIPAEYMIQVQSSLFITGREWCDFISYSNGLNMVVIRCFPNVQYQSAIHNAAKHAEAEILKTEIKVREQLLENKNIIPVEWVDCSGDIVL